jgi:hypothetical protein
MIGNTKIKQFIEGNFHLFKTYGSMVFQNKSCSCFYNKRMIKGLKTSEQVDTISKLIETIMQLRVEVKRDEAEYLINILNLLRRRFEWSPKEALTSLPSLSLKDNHGVRSKLKSLKSLSEANIAIRFSFVNKKDQGLEVA